MMDEIPYAKIEQNAIDLADLLNTDSSPRFFLRTEVILDFIMPGYMKTVKTRMEENSKKDK